MQSLKAILFDFDGTLVSSVDMYIDIFNVCLVEQGVDAKSREELRVIVFTPLEKIFANLSAVLDVEQFKKSFLAKELKLNSSQHLPLVEEVPVLLEFLQKREIKMGIVSSKTSQPMHDLLADYELADYFAAVVGRDDVSMTKPNPEPVWLGCELLNCEANETLFVGDSLLDLTAAKEAGSTFVGVLTGACNEREFKDAKADYIFRHVGEVAELVRRLTD